ncbi:MAG: matrixin family metalloprotease [Anaerolineae bacterium]
MKRALIRFALGAGLGAVIAGVGFQAAPAFGYNLMGPKWASTSQKYDPHTLAANWQSVASFGAAQWTNVTPSPFNWSVDNNSTNDVTKAAIDGAGGTLAVTTVYYSGSTITRMTVKFDQSENWYTGSGTPGSSQIDAQSVSAHEFGHSAGIGTPSRATARRAPTASRCARRTRLGRRACAASSPTIATPSTRCIRKPARLTQRGRIP